MPIKIPNLPLDPNELALHKSALLAAGRFHTAQFELLELVDEVDKLRIFVKLGQKSAFAYFVNAIGLSEDMTCNLTTVARVSRTVPELKQSVRDGLSIAKARKIAPIITPENQKHWIGLARTLSFAQLEKELVREFPHRSVQERAKPVAENRHEVVFGLDDDGMALLRSVQNLVSSQENIAATYEQTILQALKEYSEKHDPLRKAARRRKDTAEHVVNERDQHSCQAMDDAGNLCSQNRWLHIHHIVPRSEGGGDDPDNLITLCSFHHHLLHRTRDEGFTRRTADTSEEKECSG